MKRLFMSRIYLLLLLLVPLPAFSISPEEKQTLQNIRNQIFGGSRLSAAIQQTTISGKNLPFLAST